MKKTKKLFSLGIDSADLVRRKNFLSLISFVGIITLMFFSLIAIVNKNFFLFYADIAISAILILNLINLKGKKDYKWNIYIGISVIASLYIFLFLTGGEVAAGFIWYFTFPLAASFMLGSYKGAVTGLLLMIPVIITAVIPLPEPVFINYSGGLLARFFISYLIVVIFSFLIERSWETTRDKLAVIKDNLEDRVEQRTGELSEINVQLKKEVEDREKAEKALRVSEKHYRLMTESTSDLIAITTFGLRPKYKYVSPSHIQLGFKQEELIGRSGLDIMYPADKKKIILLLKQYTKVKIKKLLIKPESEFRMTLEYRIYDKSGSMQFIESTVNIIGKELLFVSKIVTDRKKEEKEKVKQQERILHSEKMETLGRLAGGVAHDLNNILGGIVGYPDLILKDLSPDSPIRSKVEAIKNSGEKAAAMIEDLLGLTRRGVIKKERVNLNKLVNNYLNSPEFERLTGLHKNAVINTALEKNLPDIEGSYVHLNKMIMNLTSNAMEAMPEGGALTFSTYSKYLDSKISGHLKNIKKGNYIVLKVTDTGIGIGPESAKRIFEPFYTNKAMKSSGTGLGMSIVLGTVIDHNGDIVLRSAKTRGTSFEIYFPWKKTKRGLDTVLKSSEDYTGEGETILVVDDNKDQRLLMENMLNTLGYKTDLVPSGESALKYIKKKRPDLIILDMIMDPGINGLETYIQIKKMIPEIKVILCTGYSDKKSIDKALKNGIRQYLKKPFSIEQLGKAVKQEIKRD
ncbi:MAG: response regulator [Acidobacteriota bacterium]